VWSLLWLVRNLQETMQTGVDLESMEVKGGHKKG